MPSTTQTVRRLGALTGGAGGQALRAVTGAVDAVRPARKPLHPRGQVRRAEVLRHGHPGPRTGVEWIDSPGTEHALVRLSAAVGLPHGWPDVQGVAIRLLRPEGPADLLLATTGRLPGTRFLLAPARSAQGHVHSTLLPYRGPHGPLLLAVLPVDEDTFELSWATLLGPWVRFATVTLHEESGEDPSYDPVVNVVPGLRQYPWVQRLRLPSYRAARRRRGERA